MAPNPHLDRIKRVELLTGIMHKFLPIKYFSCPLIIGKEKMSIFSEIINNVINKINGWHSKLLSSGGRCYPYQACYFGYAYSYASFCVSS